MRMNEAGSALGAALFILSGCGKDSAGSAPADQGRPDGGALDAGAVGTPADAAAPGPTTIAGSIAVGAYVDGWVMLGDGTKFVAPAIPGGTVVFTDPSIVGPQTVSFARVNGDRVLVSTLAGIERPEVWIGTPPPATFVERAKLVTSLPGAPDGDVVNVFAFADGLYGFGNGTAGASVDVSLSGTAGATAFDLFGWSRTFQNLTRVGFKPAVALPALPASGAAAPTVPVSLPLDRACDRTMNLTIENAATYGPVHYVSLWYTLPGGSSQPVLSLTSTQSTFALAGFALTAPFDGFRPYIDISNGDGTGGRGATTDVLVPTGEGVVVASLLATTPTLLTPHATLTGTGTPVSTPLPPGTPFTWSGIVPSAQLVSLSIRGRQKPADGTKALSWTVTAPAGTTSFTPFALPAQIGGVTTFPAGTATIVVTQILFGVPTTLDQVFGAKSILDSRTRGQQSSSYSADVLVP